MGTQGSKENGGQIKLKDYSNEGNGGGVKKERGFLRQEKKEKLGSPYSTLPLSRWTITDWKIRKTFRIQKTTK